MVIASSTGNDVYSGDHYSGNDRYSGLKTPDDAILFTVNGITAIADKKLEILIKKIEDFKGRPHGRPRDTLSFSSWDFLLF